MFLWTVNLIIKKDVKIGKIVNRFTSSQKGYKRQRPDDPDVSGEMLGTIAVSPVTLQLIGGNLPKKENKSDL